MNIVPEKLLPSLRSIARPRVVMTGLGVAFVAVVGGNWLAGSPGSAATGPAEPQAVPVESAVASKKDVPVYLQGIGTVQAYNTVTITPRVDGALQKIGFIEGQTVHSGDLLAQIDPRPYQAALDQSVGVKAKDSALLDNAKRDLDRYVTLAPQNFTSKQTLDTQRSLVAQLEAQVKSDQGAIDNAKTQLDYTTITSPIQGRTGIRQIDVGNNVHAATTTGIVVVTQMQPISVIFTLPEAALLAVNSGMAAGPLQVTALSQDGKTELDQGTVALVDNQIDQTTGTIRLKATFPNATYKLWPGGFVNTRLLQETRRNALTIPSAALQRGPNGLFTYVVKSDSTVEMRPIQVAQDADGVAVVIDGLQDGERVTTSNEYRLQPGVTVNLNAKTASIQPASAKTDAAP